MIKTKIIVTVGPACDEEQMLSDMINSGADVFRLNFSHGGFDEHSEMLGTLNSARDKHRHTTAVLGDLCGPKIRTLIIEEGQMLYAGDTVTINSRQEKGTAASFSTNYNKIIEDVQVGHRVFIDDGQIELRAAEKTSDELKCEVIVGGPLFTKKGLNLPDTDISIDSITERDWMWVDWAIEHKLDFLALSFVRTEKEIVQLKEYVQSKGSDIKIVAKIETPQALDNLEAIIGASDAVLVARGDLGVEMDLAQVPLLQKRIVHLCRQFGKPAIVATQMLQSMILSSTATRAEVSDVANAVIDLTDAVMLSGETAVGQHPVKAVKTLGRIAAATENYLDSETYIRQRTQTHDGLKLTESLARSVAHIVEDIDAKFVAVWSQGGSTARLLSKNRIDVPILSLSSNAKVCSQMCLDYGVIPRCREIPSSNEIFMEVVEKIIRERQWAKAGDKIVLVTGQPIGSAGTTNAIIVHTIGQ